MLGPLANGLVGCGACAASLTLTLALGSSIIAASWVLHRPLLAFTAAAVAVGMLFSTYRLAPPRPQHRGEPVLAMPAERHSERAGYKYNEQILYATIIFKGPVKVRRLQNFLIWKAAKTPSWRLRDS